MRLTIEHMSSPLAPTHRQFLRRRPLMEEAKEKDLFSDEALKRKDRWREQTMMERELERRVPYLLEKMKGMTEDDLVKAQVAELKRQKKEAYNKRVHERGLHSIRELRDGEEIKLDPGVEESIRKQVREDLDAIRAGSQGILEENENTIRKFVGGTFGEKNLDGADFSGEREFPSSLTRQQDEDIILAAAWLDIMPKNSLESIDEYVFAQVAQLRRKNIPPIDPISIPCPCVCVRLCCVRWLLTGACPDTLCAFIIDCTLFAHSAADAQTGNWTTADRCGSSRCCRRARSAMTPWPCMSSACLPWRIRSTP